MSEYIPGHYQQLFQAKLAELQKQEENEQEEAVNLENVMGAFNTYLSGRDIVKNLRTNYLNSKERDLGVNTMDVETKGETWDYEDVGFFGKAAEVLLGWDRGIKKLDTGEITNDGEGVDEALSKSEEDKVEDLTGVEKSEETLDKDKSLDEDKVEDTEEEPAIKTEDEKVELEDSDEPKDISTDPDLPPDPAWDDVKDTTPSVLKNYVGPSEPQLDAFGKEIEYKGVVSEVSPEEEAQMQAALKSETNIKKKKESSIKLEEKSDDSKEASTMDTLRSEMESDDTPIELSPIEGRFSETSESGYFDPNEAYKVSSEGDSFDSLLNSAKSSDLAKTKIDTIKKINKIPDSKTLNVGDTLGGLE